MNPVLIVTLLLVVIIASFLAMVILMLLQAVGLVRFKKNTHFIIWSVVGGIVLTAVYWLIKK